VPRNHPKFPKPHSEKPARTRPAPIELPETDESPSEIATDIMRLALLRVREEVRGIVDGSIDHEKHGPAERCAFLAKETAPVARELRLAEKGAAQAIEDITEATVRAWFRLQTNEMRVRVANEALELGSSARRSAIGAG